MVGILFFSKETPRMKTMSLHLALSTIVTLLAVGATGCAVGTSEESSERSSGSQSSNSGLDLPPIQRGAESSNPSGGSTPGEISGDERLLGLSRAMMHRYEDIYAAERLFGDESITSDQLLATFGIPHRDLLLLKEKMPNLDELSKLHDRLRAYEADALDARAANSSDERQAGYKAVAAKLDAVQGLPDFRAALSDPAAPLSWHRLYLHAAQLEVNRLLLIAAITPAESRGPVAQRFRDALTAAYQGSLHFKALAEREVISIDKAFPSCEPCAREFCYAGDQGAPERRFDSGEACATYRASHVYSEQRPLLAKSGALTADQMSANWARLDSVR
jgi:hypothetical protein